MKNKANGKIRPKIEIPLLAIATLLSLSLYSQASEGQSVRVKTNESISFLCFKMYGGFSPEMVRKLSNINPQIEDWDDLPAGKEITFLPRKEMNRVVREQKTDVAVITFLRSPVRIKKATEAYYEKAQLNMILQSNDHIEVESGGRVELMMSAGRIIRLDGGSTLGIGILMRDEQRKSVIGRFKLFLGRLWGKVLRARSFGKKEMYVSTPTLIAGVRGTAYDMRLKRDESTIIKVFEGEVEIYNPLQKMPESGVIKDFQKPHRVRGPSRVKGPHRVTEKEWNEILLRQYQQIIVTKEGISAPTTFDFKKERQTEWISWNEERDLRLTEGRDQ